MFSLCPIVVFLACGFTSPPFNSSQTTHDERLLGLNNSTGPVIIDCFRKNMLTPTEAVEVGKLVERLGDDDYRQREQAHQELLFWRAGAEGVLRRYEFDPQLERRRRVRQILGRGLGRWSNTQAEAAARLLRKFPSIEAVRVLIEYFPDADDPALQRELAAALRDFATQDAAFAAFIRSASTTPAVLRSASLFAEDKAKELSPTLQALDQTRTFFALIAQADAGKLAGMTRLPFTLGNGVILTAPDQRDDFFKQAIANYRANASLTFMHVTRGEELLRFADDHERAFLEAVPADELRVVHVRMRRDWQTEEVGAILIRVSPQGPAVIGLAHTGIRGVRGK